MTTPTDSPAIPCTCCGQTLGALYQPTLYAEMPPYWYLTCQESTCVLFGYTFSSRQYPPVNIDLYLSKGEVQSERQA